MGGLVRKVAAKRANHFGRGRLSSSISVSGVFVYGSNSTTAQYKAEVEIDPLPERLISFDHPIILLYRADSSFMPSTLSFDGSSAFIIECVQ